jgi:hypothetical protein
MQALRPPVVSIQAGFTVSFACSGLEGPLFRRGQVIPRDDARVTAHPEFFRELQADGRTVTATADGRTALLLPCSRGQYASGHPFRSGAGNESRLPC